MSHIFRALLFHLNYHFIVISKGRTTDDVMIKKFRHVKLYNFYRSIGRTMVERTTQGMRSSSLSFSLPLGISASKYFTEFKPLDFAVSIIEYKIALAFAPLAVFLNNQFLRPITKSFTAHSAPLLSMYS
jgi:hypothetical protein